MPSLGLGARASTHPPATAARVRDWNVSIVPRPRSLVAAPGAYLWPERARIRAITAEERAVAGFLQRDLRAGGVRATIVRSRRERVDVSLRLVPSTARTLGREGYTLSVSPDGIKVVAPFRAGLFYGVQTLEQVCKFLPGMRLATRDVRVTDWPMYEWRGIHLDVSRHFFRPRVIERYIDVAAHYKLNTFHWHLTDDQAWRIEIKRYPKLTDAERCAARDCSFYTQAEIRRIVAYATERSVRVVPEIDVPGHSGAALAAYPEFACGGNVRAHVVCPTDAAVAFVKNVLTEVLALFPGPYVHVGGDEVDLGEWRGAREVAELMRTEHLTATEQVQPYFTHRLARFLRMHGRRLIGWDEIVDGAPRDAVVMLWQPQTAAAAAIAAGHDVVLTPNRSLYFDAYQGDRAQEPAAFGDTITARDVYAFDPMPIHLPASEREHVLGAQANVWTEYIATEQHLFYMLLPRELALAEAVWSRPQDRDYNDFLRRLPEQFTWLSSRRYSYRVPEPVCTSFPDLHRAAGDRTALTLTVPLDANIRYTLDGSPPSPTSRLYRAPLRFGALHGALPSVRARTFAPDGRYSTVVRCAL
ncbi:MAG: family 20 glycosylhydrolase [Candidatus Eremiobacteraeota bacterium]|nr:family 20 glycosylhydrolase [Candidatus Eremiobacteraeota bacterium]